MAVNINTVTATTFSINGTTYNKIFQPLAMGTNNIGIYNTYDTRFQLIDSTHYSEFVVDGSSYASRALVVQALLPVVFSNLGGGGGGTSEWGAITGTLAAQTDLQAALDGKANNGAVYSWGAITNKPTTISGFGITDAYTKTEADGKYSLLGHTHTTAQITNLSSYTGFDTKYLGINAKAADSQLLNGFGVSNISTGSTVVQRDSAGDISTRLFRSEYDTTNPTVNLIMTQVDTASNNYIRPSTPAQFRAGVTDAFYLPIGGKASDSDRLDGLDSTAFLLVGAKAADSNLLDGLDSTAFVRTTTYTAADILTKLKTVDGSGSGLDADLLGGIPASNYLLKDGAVAFGDGDQLTFGDGNDMIIKHSANHNYIDLMNNSKLYVRPNLQIEFAFHQDGKFSADYLAEQEIPIRDTYLNKTNDITKTAGALRFNDNLGLVFGTTGAMDITHSGGSNYLNLHTGDLFVRNGINNRFRFFRSSGQFDATSLSEGGTLLSDKYFAKTGIVVKSEGYIQFNDTVGTVWGTGGDLTINHDGNHNYFDSFNGDFIFRSSINNRFIVYKSTGNIWANGTMTADNFILSSDERYKQDISVLGDTQIKVDWKSFKMKKDPTQLRYGVIAQELEVNHPEFVRTDEKGYKSVAYTDLLIAKISELETRIKQLEK